MGHSRSSVGTAALGCPPRRSQGSAALRASAPPSKLALNLFHLGGPHAPLLFRSNLVPVHEFLFPVGGSYAVPGASHPRHHRPLQRCLQPPRWTAWPNS